MTRARTPNGRTRAWAAGALTVAAVTMLTTAAAGEAAQSRWRGLDVAPEARCAPYDADDYRYPQAVELTVVAELGGVYGPYTDRWFRSRRETDIEHIVARSEAHDSGLCRADGATRRRFASDPLNLTLAAPDVNRRQKIAHDAADWLPDRNRCWFAARVIAVRQRYRLSIDRREAAALDAVLARCSSTGLVRGPRGARQPATPAGPIPWDDDGNGRVTCAEARRHGIAPVGRDHPAYRHMRDADGDGVVCER